MEEDRKRELAKLAKEKEILLAKEQETLKEIELLEKHVIHIEDDADYAKKLFVFRALQWELTQVEYRHEFEDTTRVWV